MKVSFLLWRWWERRKKKTRLRDPRAVSPTHSSSCHLHHFPAAASEFWLSFTLINGATEASSQWASSSSIVLESHELEVRAALLYSHGPSFLPAWGKMKCASSITLTLIYSPCAMKKKGEKKTKKKQKGKGGLAVQRKSVLDWGESL